jgi:type I restriction enzyme S subunit
LYYWFKSDFFWVQAGSRKSQTDMADYINLADIRSLKISLPPISIQRTISHVLGALDDKIAVNDRIASTTLSLCQSYHEAEVSGMTWGADTFGSVAAVYGGGTPSTAVGEYWDGEIPWATPTDVTGLRAPYLFNTSRRISQAGLQNCASQLYPTGSIFMTSRATIGSFAVAQVPTAVNQGFIVVVPPEDKLRWWLFHEMRSRVDEMIALANGSTFLELSRKNFKAMPVRLPSDERLRNFDARVDPLHERAAKALEESVKLAELRDTLLPKLMSGEIRVRDAEREVENAL